MPYYKDTNDKIHFLDSEEFAYLLPAGSVQITDEEAESSEVPQPAIPSSCTRGQGRLALLDAGKLLTVEAMIASIPDEVDRMRAQIEYERETWERANPFLQQMWANLGGTSEELDALFTTAVTL